jgi:hypothetical protein
VQSWSASGGSYVALTPEKKVKNKVVALLKDAGAYYFYPVTGGYGGSGVPDIIVCYYGRFIAIECKAGKNTLSALQRANIEAIKRNNGVALVINEGNIDEVSFYLGICKAAFCGGHSGDVGNREEPASSLSSDPGVGQALENQ